MRRDWRALEEYAEKLLRLADENSLHGWAAMAALYQGAAVAMLGRTQAGLAQIREGIDACRSRGVRVQSSGALGAQAEAQARAGDPESGLATLDETLSSVAKTGEHHWEAELYRLKGELILMQGEKMGAEASLTAENSFQHAIEVAHRQQARSWQLRATTSLARLWRQQGRVDEAREMLAAIYDWFSEGFDSTDLVEARTLLEELSP
jgi:adenylate cyclase